MAKSSEPILIDTIREANDLHSVVLQLHSNGYVSSNTKCVLEKYFCGDCDCLDLSSITNAQSGENVRFPADVESFVICLAFLSTKAYELLTKCWPDGLPTIDTVREWHRRYDGMPGEWLLRSIWRGIRVIIRQLLFFFWCRFEHVSHCGRQR